MRWVFNPFTSTLAPLADAANGYVHVQSVATSVWTVQHNLGYRPGGITVEDSSGEDWIGFEVQHIDDNELTLTFGGAFGGVAYVS